MTHKYGTFNKTRTGFTVLELLVVVAIIGFLSSVSIIALSSSQSYKRDQQRKIDQLTIVKAAELYTNDFGAPPSQLCREGADGCTASSSYVPANRSPLAMQVSFDPAQLVNSFFEVPRALALIKPCQIDGTCKGGGGGNCGDGACANGETIASCPADCGCVVDGYCDSTVGENATNCIADCHCGNNSCEAAYAETTLNCPADCSCNNNGTCNQQETTYSCVADCHCGNNICDYGETTASCAQDCGCNSNALCEPARGETAGNCIVDCHCGNNQCEYSLYGETAPNCTADCGCNGNGICETSRGEDTTTCMSDCHCGDNTCESTTYSETFASCSQDCRCLVNGSCELQLGEDTTNCPLDCSPTEPPPPPTPPPCGNGICDDIPAHDGIPAYKESYLSCSLDCTCKVDGHLDLCCLQGGTGPACNVSGGSLAGYYGVCNGDVCQQRYLLSAPAVTCSADVNCTTPMILASQVQDKFVSSPLVNGNRGNWLLGLDPYLPNVPADPGHHALGTKYDYYYCSTNPDIVLNHGFCCWMSLERAADNFNPYNDIIQTPTGQQDTNWTPLCTK